MDENNIPYYLDCCIRENGLMKKYTHVDVTIHLSYWGQIKFYRFYKI